MLGKGLIDGVGRDDHSDDADGIMTPLPRRAPCTMTTPQSGLVGGGGV
jgi:hypothetical protein